MGRVRRVARGWRQSFTTVVLGIFVGAMLSAGSTGAATPPGGAVSDTAITANELLAGATAAGLTHNHRFAPGPEAPRAHQAFVGTLRFDGVTMTTLSAVAGGGISNPVLGKDTTFFPDVSIEFFTAAGHLVPVTQDVILNGALPGTQSYWDVIAQPGRVWSEPGDNGWNRASFPFALVNSLEGETHTGLALFLYRGNQVSPVRFQIVQMTSPFRVPEYFTAWGTSGAQYLPAGSGRDAQRLLLQRVREYRAERAAKLRVRPWSQLAHKAGVSQATLDAFTTFPDFMQGAVIHKGVLYRTDCPTAAGPFPYCDDVRYGVWSVTKSAMMNVAFLRLAQKYGTAFIDAPIVTYAPTAAASGWETVTYRHLANMASGHGPEGVPTCYLCDYDRWYIAPSKAAKTAEALAYPGPFVPPGTVQNYRDQDAYLLGVALDAFVKAQEGPQASVWKLLRCEVYRPIGIFHAPTNATVESDGSTDQPLMAYGYYATLDDLAKIGLLYERGGKWKGKQILEPALVARFLPSPMPPAEGLDASGNGSSWYYKNWWFKRMESVADCTRYIASMEGWGGTTVALATEGTVVLRMRNLWKDTPHPEASMFALIDELSPLCSDPGDDDGPPADDSEP